MSKVKQISSSTMLDLWRPPKLAGDPIGCMTTTYTFSPGLFDEQCLARFLEIESEPDREDLAFLLERETRLGSVYAGVMVDYTQAGVEHSLRWDVLPIRIPKAKQHAKLSLLVWSNHIRIIVSSANLTESGYRFNHEVTGSVEITPVDSKPEILKDVLSLPPVDRVELVEKILASFEFPTHEDIDAAWAKEAEDRIEAFERGDVGSTPVNSVGKFGF